MSLLKASHTGAAVGVAVKSDREREREIGHLSIECDVPNCAPSLPPAIKVKLLIITSSISSSSLFEQCNMIREL